MDPTVPTPAASKFGLLADTTIRLALLVILLLMCFSILKPFLLPVAWGIILAVALNPLFQKLETALGGRRKLAAVLIGLFGLALLLVPSFFVFGSLAEGTMQVVHEINAGTAEIPPPADSVKEWPIVGEKVYQQWLAASQDAEGVFMKFRPQILGILSGVAGAIAGLGGDLLLFIVATILGAIFLGTSDSLARAFRTLFTKCMGARGEEMTKLTSDTIQNVAKGVLGVAVIQAIICGIGLLVAGIPFAGLWMLLIMILAVIQLPPILILIPIIIYQFTRVETTPAVIFMIYSILAGMSDNLLKPLLLGRGMKTPMLVILLGAIGGLIWAGFIGLFIGAVVLSLGYELMLTWLGAPAPVETSTQPANPAEA